MVAFLALHNLRCDNAAVLDVQGCVDVNSTVEQFLHIKVTFGMPTAWRIGVGQLVDKCQLGSSTKYGIQVHLFEPMSLVFNVATGDDFQAFEQRLGLLAPMCLNNAEDQVDPLAPPRVGCGEHFVGLAGAGRRPEKNLQTTS